MYKTDLYDAFKKGWLEMKINRDAYSQLNKDDLIKLCIGSTITYDNFSYLEKIKLGSLKGYHQDWVWDKNELTKLSKDELICVISYCMNSI
jgi:hypothetical protein